MGIWHGRAYSVSLLSHEQEGKKGREGGEKKRGEGGKQKEEKNRHFNYRRKSPSNQTLYGPCVQSAWTTQTVHDIFESKVEETE